jgi:hypothetical protein
MVCLREVTADAAGERRGAGDFFGLAGWSKGFCARTASATRTKAMKSRNTVTRPRAESEQTMRQAIAQEHRAMRRARASS